MTEGTEKLQEKMLQLLAQIARQIVMNVNENSHEATAQQMRILRSIMTDERIKY